MTSFYAEMIIKGFRKFEQCPDPLKPQVKERLNELNAGYLVTA
jgi:hypothetical protein